MQEKESIMVVWCELKIPSLRITVRHHSASLVTKFSIRTSQPSNILIKKKMCNVRTFVTHEYEIFFVRSYDSYENVIWPNLCYTHKHDILCLHFFLHIKMCVMSISVLLLFRIWTAAYQNVPKDERVSFTCFLRLDQIKRYCVFRVTALKILCRVGTDKKMFFFFSTETKRINLSKCIKLYIFQKTWGKNPRFTSKFR